MDRILNLTATAVNPLTLQNESGVTVHFLRDGISDVANATTNASGIASVNWTYPLGNQTHTIVPEVYSDTSVANCTLIEQPITLTVGYSTSLLLWTDLNYSTVDQVIHARLFNGLGLWEALFGCVFHE